MEDLWALPFFVSGAFFVSLALLYQLRLRSMNERFQQKYRESPRFRAVVMLRVLAYKLVFLATGITLSVIGFQITFT